MTAAFTTLFNFDQTNGSSPNGSLIADASGNLFGTTESGGAYGYGTVFEVPRTASGYAANPTILVSFDQTTGAFPIGSLTEDASGNLFGTAANGGAFSGGTVFEVARTASGYANSPIILASFNGANGYVPNGSLIADASGNLFGTTASGGTYGYGTVFELAKTASGYASDPTTLASFDAASSGTAGPNNGLVADADGNLFGTTYAGGANQAGTVFEIVRNATGYASTPVTLVTFGYDFINGVDPGFGYSNGARPGSLDGSPPLILNASGNLFGTTQEGGAYGDGTVFEVVKTATGYSSTPPTLVSFNQPDVRFPSGGLVADAHGNLFGMTTRTNFLGSGGTLFEVANTATGYASTPTSLVGLDDAYPISSLAADTSGNLFGVSQHGGEFGWGSAFAITGSGFAVNHTVDYSVDARSGGTEGVFVDLASFGAKDGFGAFNALPPGSENVRGTNNPYPGGSGVGDILLGSDGDNVFQGLAGADHIDGRGGSDTADYSADARFGGSAGIYADLGHGAVVDGFGDTDVLVSIENIIGTDSPSPSLAGYSDVILGSDGANRIDARGGNDIVIAGGGNDTVLGGTGNDYLSGGDGNDIIVGGEGNDVMVGGAGSDTFLIDLASLIGGQTDTITDFLPGTDSIQFPASTQGQLAFGDGYIGCGTGLGQYYALMVPGATAAQLRAGTSFV